MSILMTCCVYVPLREVQKTIDMNERFGWSLEGKPDELRNGSFMLTFKKWGDPDKEEKPNKFSLENE